MRREVMNPMRFGTNVQEEMTQWWRDHYLPNVFYPQYGNDMTIAAVVLDITADHVWQNPLLHPGLVLATGEGERYSGPVGLFCNISGKLGFVLRVSRLFGVTDEPVTSALAQERPDLVEPGDFPYAGAGFYLGYPGGVSGLPDGADDWDVYQEVVDQLVVVRGNAARPALRELDARWPDVTPEIKYLGRQPVPFHSRVRFEPLAGAGWPTSGPGPHALAGWTDDRLAD